MFGRGGEEIDSLAANGIPFEVVPGITAALGVAAFAGIPLTHRDYAQACLFVTGHLKDGSMDLDWPALARPRQTVVVYMGLLCLPILCAKLIEHGQSRDLPAAVVQQGTAPTQRVVTGTLATLPDLALRAQLHGPTLIIVGDVVRLRERLNWFQPDGVASERRMIRTRVELADRGPAATIRRSGISPRTAPRGARPRTPPPRRASACPAWTGCGGRAASPCRG